MQIALTIAGSDSGGGAGIQADLKTFHQYGVFGTSVVTAITAQNTRSVLAVEPVSIEVVRAQIEAVASDLPPQAVKTGMLATAELVEAVASGIVEHELSNYVLDPVMIATSGDRLLEPQAERAVLERLVPLATVVTPNVDEAAALIDHTVEDVGAMELAAQRLIERGANSVLVKGAHLPGTHLVDLLVTSEGTRRFEHPRINTSSTHGTGCTLSAAIAAGLALGNDLVTAVESALAFVHAAITDAPGLGGGHGPLNHFVSPRGEGPRADG